MPTNLVRFIPVALYIPLMIALYLPAYRVMVSWWENEDYNYCYFVPLIVLYLIWEKRDALFKLPAQPAWWGGGLVLAGLLLFWLGELGGEFYSLYLSSWFVLLGLLILHWGWEKVKAIRFPLLLIPAMFPFPNAINNPLSLKLKLMSSAIGVKFLQLSGMSAYREGNVIDLDFTRLQVVDACSGLRYLLPLILLAVLIAGMVRLRWWQKVVLVVSSIPLTVIVNSFRIASVGWLYPVFGPKVAEGFFHDFSGWVIFMVSLGILLGEMWLMKRWFPLPSAKIIPVVQPLANGDGTAGSAPFGRMQWLMTAVASLCLVATVALSQGVEFREKVPLKQSFSSFPVVVGQWQGTRQVMEKLYLDALDLSDYLLIDFRDSQHRQINLYVSYNESQSKGKSSHSPSSCLPGGGWVFKESGIVPVDLSGGARLEVQRAVMEKTGQKQLSYYWFAQRGRVLHSLSELKFYAFWDALTQQRTDGALVRIITPVAADEDLNAAEQRLQGFVRQVHPLLVQYIPGKKL